MFIKAMYNSCKYDPHSCFIDFDRLGVDSESYPKHVRIPLHGYKIFRIYPSDVLVAEDLAASYDLTFEFYHDDEVGIDPYTGEYEVIAGKTPHPEGFGTIEIQYVEASGAEFFVGSAEDFELLIRPDYTVPKWSVWTDTATGDMLQWTGSQWIPYGGGGGATVDFQYIIVPDPKKLPGKVVQYVGDSGDCKREGEGGAAPDLDPDIGKTAFRGDWIHSVKVLEWEDAEHTIPKIDPETGLQAYHYSWEILMHQGQIIEVDTLNDSNWKPKEEFLGYRIYLTKPWDEEILKPDGTSYSPKKYKHWTRGWYQISERHLDDGSSYNPKQYEWIHVLDGWTRAHLKRLEGIPARYYNPSNENLNKPYEWWIQDALDIIKQEDQCTIKFRAHYSEAMQNKVQKDTAFNPAEPGQPENPLSINREYQYILLEDIPLPVPKAKKTYECGTDSPYMSANLNVEVTDNGVPYVPGDRVYIPSTITTPTIGAGVLGVDWSRTSRTIGTIAYTKEIELTGPMITIMKKARYQNQFRNEPIGILRIPAGSIPVSTVDIEITYDFDNTNFGPEDDYVGTDGLMGFRSPVGLTLFRK